MKLLDIIPSKPAPVFPSKQKLSPLLTDLLESAEALRADSDALGRVEKCWPAQRYAAHEQRMVVSNARADSALEILKVAGALPAGLIPEDWVVRRFGRLSVTTMAPLLRVADQFGFAIFTEHFLSDESWRAASGATKVAAASFRQNNGEHFRVYAVAPVKYYSCAKLIKHEDGEIVAPSGWEQAFAAVEMMIPVMRTLQQDLAQCQEDAQRNWDELRRVEGRVKKVEADINALSTRIDGLQRQVQHEREARIRQAAKPATKLPAGSMIAYDPLLIAIPTGCDIRDGKTPVRLGPCWGPDFDDNVLKALGMKKCQHAGAAWAAVEKL